MHNIIHKALPALLFALSANYAVAALSVDRSRIIFNEGDKSVSLDITNNSNDAPYLAQGWLDDEQENKVKGKFTVLPPLQRLEPGSKTAVRLQALPDLSSLPRDRESLFYLNIREIPTKSNSSNTLTLALQLRLKMFYRPAALKITDPEGSYPGIKAVTLERKDNNYTLVNPTPYYLTFTALRNTPKGEALSGFEPVMVSPKASTQLTLKGQQPGTNPVLVLIDDYGGPVRLSFKCTQAQCKAEKAISDLSPQ